MHNYTKEGFDENSALRIIGGFGALFLSYLGGKYIPWAVRNQNKRYERLMECLKEEGYEEKFCKIYMDHPCGRSVVKTALKQTDNFEHYNDLKEKYPLIRMF